MGITASHVLSMTTPDDPAYENQPKHWNSAHAVTLNAVGSEISGAFGNGGGITFGLSADGKVTAAAPAGAPSPINFSAGTTSSNIGSVVFSDSNGLAFGLNGSTITGSYTQSTHAHSQYSFSNLNGVTFGTNGSTLTASVQTNYAGVGESVGTVAGTDLALTVNTDGVSILYPKWLTTAALSNHSHGDPTLALTNLTGTTASASNGFTLSLSGNAAQTVQTQNMVAVVASAANGNGTFSSGSVSLKNGSNITFSTGANVISMFAPDSQTVQTQNLFVEIVSGANGNLTASSGTLSVKAGNNITISTGAGVYSIHGAAAGGANLTLQDSATTLQVTKVIFSNLNGVSFGLNTAASIVTVTGSVAAQSNQTVGLYATGNTTNNSSTTFDARTLGTWNALGAATVGFSNGSVQLSVPATSSIVGTNGISISTNGSTISVQPQWISSYENFDNCGSNTMTLNAASISHAVAFYVPQPISGSFIRFPVLMTTNSTTIATMASATASASGELYSTWNAVVYSLGAGGNSKSLQSVASGSGGFTFNNKISITNSTQYSITQAFSAQANGAGTTRTTQYSISNTNYSFTTNQIATEWSSGRFMDIPFASSLSPGPYWLVFGYSSSSASAGAAGLAALTNCNVRYSNHYAVSQVDIAFGIMGSTNLTSGGQLGAGSFSTAGGGTTNSIPISAISSSASQVRPYFQILRSA